MLEYADAITETPVAVPDAVLARWREKLNEAQPVDLTSAIGLGRLSARASAARLESNRRVSVKQRCARCRPEPGTEADEAPNLAPHDPAATACGCFITPARAAVMSALLAAD